ncbi:hypothetical protein [Helicobacter sp. T3_23-1059]
MEIVKTMGESKEQVVFVIDKNNHITPKTAQDEQILIDEWNINDDILEEFLDFLNKSKSDNNEKIALLTSTDKNEFLEREGLYDMALSILGYDNEPTQEQIDNKIDEITDSALFGCENLILVKKD